MIALIMIVIVGVPVIGYMILYEIANIYMWNLHWKDNPTKEEWKIKR